MATSTPAVRASFSSARMLEAQCTFQNVVKEELQLLLVDGMKREDAVKLLLRRIVASTEPPEATAVRGVMRQFQMSYDDAMRALIVKQELGRLKRQGLDSFAAIEELTRKMRSREEQETKEVGKKEIQDEIETGSDNAVKMMDEVVQHKEIMREDKENLSQEEEKNKEHVTQDVDDQQNKFQKGKKWETSMAILADETASPVLAKDGNEMSLSLCQRIGQVSISSGNTPEKELEGHDDRSEKNEHTNGDEIELAGEKNKANYKSPLRVRSPLNKNLADLTPQSRKRRAASGMKYESSINNRNNANDCNVKPLFPNLKKQKLCATVGDGFLQIVTLKSKSTSANSSKSTSVAGSSGSPSSGEKGGGSKRSDHSTKNLLKRQRASPIGMADNDESLIAEELRASHVHHRHHINHHHSKRQKSGSTH